MKPYYAPMSRVITMLEKRQATRIFITKAWFIFRQRYPMILSNSMAPMVCTVAATNIYKCASTVSDARRWKVFPNFVFLIIATPKWNSYSGNLVALLKRYWMPQRALRSRRNDQTRQRWKRSEGCGFW